ncbi:carbohydrate ABC transporter permease [Dictyoglomus thermophilum]|uniref:sn-glycerol-3-phosphate transport system permease protein UgpE n=3 Tax=Pseudomonadati TaxID=3379134 RepID=B5YAX1_DICT6|nr:carbohydrate ABC transporter permease [Dictyoglomus thermophilum]ACI19115.1 multiple sugar-binding transport system permease [Dictyoglomus thermophilum H-6-12]MCX7720900.1 carbohydrate ABC transporter permease [Dictyoglomus thermophilum]TYT20956.1 carbohydrate ABC transporter permease [Dictyoglomus thermophilum]
MKGNLRVRSIFDVLKFLIILIFSSFYILPFAIVVINSFKKTGEVVLNPLALPKEFKISNYFEAAERMNYFRSFFNTFVITVASIAIIVIFSSMTAYIFARKKWSINKIFFSIMAASMIIPFQSVMIPLVKIYGSLNMLNNMWSLIYMYLGFGTAFAVFLYHGFIKSIPLELEEAALVDGATTFQAFWKIVFPLLKPVTTTLIILDALWIWNDFLLPSLILISAEKRTLQLSTFYFYGTFTSNYGLAMAALVLTVFPIIVVSLFMQKYIIAGIVRGAIR